MSVFNRDVPYNDLPLLPPKAEIENMEILRAAARAHSALGALKGRSVIIPNSAMLINTLALYEAKASSEVENIVTTSDNLYKAVASSLETKGDKSAKEVVRYRLALWSGFNRLSQRKIFDEHFFIKIVQKIKGDTEGIRDFRKAHRIYVQNNVSHEIIYTPPEGVNVIRAKLRNLSEYLNHDDKKLDPLIKLAIAHYQFEAIHPFIDGNGRTGRIINSLFLVKAGLLEYPILYLSKYINENKARYHKLLKGVTERSGWVPWILFNIDAIEKMSKYTLSKVNAIRNLLDETAGKVKKKLPKIYTKELVELLFCQPYCKIGFLVEEKICARNAAGRYLHELEEIKVLKKLPMGKENLYINVKLYNLLQDKNKPALKI